jgi:hypothetical protein
MLRPPRCRRQCGRRQVAAYLGHARVVLPENADGLDSAKPVAMEGIGGAASGVMGGMLQPKRALKGIIAFREHGTRPKGPQHERASSATERPLPPSPRGAPKQSPAPHARLPRLRAPQAASLPQPLDRRAARGARRSRAAHAPGEQRVQLGLRHARWCPREKQLPVVRGPLAGRHKVAAAREAHLRAGVGWRGAGGGRPRSRQGPRVGGCCGCGGGAAGPAACSRRRRRRSWGRRRRLQFMCGGGALVVRSPRGARPRRAGGRGR